MILAGVDNRRRAGIARLRSCDCAAHSLPKKRACLDPGSPVQADIPLESLDGEPGCLESRPATFNQANTARSSCEGIVYQVGGNQQKKMRVERVFFATFLKLPIGCA